MTKHQSEAERRTQILAAARTLFVERGYLAARVEDIARKAGLSKGAVYFYFSSKKAIFEALAEQEYNRTIAFLLQAEAAPIPASQKLMIMARQYLDYFSGLEDPPRFFLLMTEMAIRDEAIRENVQAIHSRYVQGLAAIIAQGSEEGIFRPVDAESLSTLLKALIDGISGQAAAGMRPDVARLTTAGMGILLHGLLTKEPPSRG
jgi:AcrR family transcriptional regulator